MKTIFLNTFLISLLLIPACFGQSLEENQKDAFTKRQIKRTSWETLSMSMDFTAYYRISKIDSTIYFDLKMMIASGSVFAINKGQEIMFKLTNGEIVKSGSLEYAITCTGCGAKGYVGSAAQGIDISYLLDSTQINLLKNNVVEKVRIYTTDGYVEHIIKSGAYTKLKKSLSLIE
ncbi:MAG: hypothetical protein JWO58_2435 [Chitinophagaceae bacterium]|nr:hypothetical protein [Chitinophagaceae bacterium]